ncbi:MAG: hypothetical protein K2X82_08440 [Gemmataceae bacterium]|nr:hypothetical protein [Gemmataceae bacterium]
MTAEDETTPNDRFRHQFGFDPGPWLAVYTASQANDPELEGTIPAEVLLILAGEALALFRTVLLTHDELARLAPETPDGPADSPAVLPNLGSLRAAAKVHAAICRYFEGVR